MKTERSLNAQNSLTAIQLKLNSLRKARSTNNTKYNNPTASASALKKNRELENDVFGSEDYFSED